MIDPNNKSIKYTGTNTISRPTINKKSLNVNFTTSLPYHLAKHYSPSSLETDWITSSLVVGFQRFSYKQAFNYLLSLPPNNFLFLNSTSGGRFNFLRFNNSFSAFFSRSYSFLDMVTKEDETKNPFSSYLFISHQTSLQ